MISQSIWTMNWTIFQQNLFQSQFKIQQSQHQHQMIQLISNQLLGVIINMVKWIQVKSRNHVYKNKSHMVIEYQSYMI